MIEKHLLPYRPDFEAARVYDAEGDCVAVCDCGDAQTDEDNTRLFAAAPAMLKALNEAESELERMEAATGNLCDPAVILAIRAAITQATEA